MVRRTPKSKLYFTDFLYKSQHIALFIQRCLFQQKCGNNAKKSERPDKQPVLHENEIHLIVLIGMKICGQVHHAVLKGLQTSDEACFENQITGAD